MLRKIERRRAKRARQAEAGEPDDVSDTTSPNFIRMDQPAHYVHHKTEVTRKRRKAGNREDEAGHDGEHGSGEVPATPRASIPDDQVEAGGSHLDLDAGGPVLSRPMYVKVVNTNLSCNPGRESELTFLAIRGPSMFHVCEQWHRLLCSDESLTMVMSAVSCCQHAVYQKHEPGR